MLFSVMCGAALCSLVSFVKTVSVDFEGATFSLLMVSQVCRVMKKA